MIYGVTGTRNGMSPAQKMALLLLLAGTPEREVRMLHHGGACGADQDAIYIALRHGWQVTEHQPEGEGPEAFLNRNHDIVDACAMLIAAPQTLEEQRRSGTWSTIRYARKNGVPVVVLDPG